MTNDFNLTKVAQLRGVEVLNINEWPLAKPVVRRRGDEVVISRRQGVQQGVAPRRRTRVVVDKARKLRKTITRRHRCADDRRQDDLRPLREAGRGGGARAGSGTEQSTAAGRRSRRCLPSWGARSSLSGDQSLYRCARNDELLSTLVDRTGTAHWCARHGRGDPDDDRRAFERSGLERLTPGRTYVFVCNHQSIYDIPILFWGLPFQLRIIAKASLGRVPFIGWHLRRSGHMLVDRSRPDRTRILGWASHLTTNGLSYSSFRRARAASMAGGAVQGRQLPLALDPPENVPISVSAGHKCSRQAGKYPGTVRLIVHDRPRHDSLTVFDASDSRAVRPICADRRPTSIGRRRLRAVHARACSAAVLRQA